MKTKWILAVAAVLGLSGGLAYVVMDYRAFLATPLPVPERGLVFEVAPGASISEIARRLQQQGVLRAPLYLQLYARLNGLARRLKAGEYAIATDTTPRALLEQLAAGRVIQHALTIVEGWTFRQMMEAIAHHAKIQHTLQGLDDDAIMARLGYPGQHPEGRFFPDTYYFPAGTTDVAFLKKAYATLERRLTQSWEKRAPSLPLQDAYEALILASIIEKETSLADERREIAGVFVRRLQRGMMLQSDPTVIYGLGQRFDGDLRKTDLQHDTPYNTYTRKGLPPTPIALVGADSIAAALNPTPGDTLYFVATGDGKHEFSTTLSEHNQLVRKYQLNRSRSAPSPAL